MYREQEQAMTFNCRQNVAICKGEKSGKRSSRLSCERGKAELSASRLRDKSHFRRTRDAAMHALSKCRLSVAGQLPMLRQSLQGSACAARRAARTSILMKRTLAATSIFPSTPNCAIVQLARLAGSPRASVAKLWVRPGKVHASHGPYDALLASRRIPIRLEHENCSSRR
jgi:hypothetical protein